MSKSKYNLYSRAYFIDFIIVSIILITIAQEAILDGAYISAAIIIISVIFLLGKIRYLSESIYKEDVFYVEKCCSFSIKLFGNYIQCLNLVPIGTVKKGNGATIYASIPVISINKVKFKISDSLHCRFVDNYDKGFFIDFYKIPKEEKDS